MNSMKRRDFLGMAALSALLARDARAEAHGGIPGLPHFPPKAKRVIYLFQSVGSSQMELFDYKPRLVEFQGSDLPESIRAGQRLTGMSASQSSFPVVPSKFAFERRGESGAWVSELLPHTARIADQPQAQVGMNGKREAQFGLGLRIDEGVAPARRYRGERPYRRADAPQRRT